MNVSSANEGTPDATTTVYTNGNVITVDGAFSVAHRFAVRDGRFIAVGDDEVPEMEGARIVDLDGRTVLPGFIDSHAHILFRAMESLAIPTLEGLDSVASICAAIREAAATRDAGCWIVTSPIGVRPDHFHLPESLVEGRWPTREELDAAAPHHPVYIPAPTSWPHPAIFNSAGFALLGIDAASADPEGLTIERDPGTGAPLGPVLGLDIYTDTPVKQRLLSLLPQHPEGEIRRVVARAMEENLSVGITSIYEGHMNAAIPLLSAMHDAGELSNRVTCAYEVPMALTAPESEAWFEERADAGGRGTGDARFKVLGVTASLDGAIQFGRALMREPYETPAGEMGNGASAASLEKIVEIGRMAVRHDVRLNILAAGSGAVDLAMQALRVIDAETPLRGREWVVQHFQHPSREQIAQLHDFGMIAQTYSSVDFSKGALVYRERVSGDAWESVVPLRWWIDGGVVIGQGSDSAHFNPLFQIWESLVRVDGRTGESLLTAPKSITRSEAIRLYTANGASVMQWQGSIGSIEVGKFADFVVLDRDILTCDVDDVRTAKVLATCLAGEPLHDPHGLIRADRAGRVGERS
jgi:predicted amidohydrolase YtcJ